MHKNSFSEFIEKNREKVWFSFFLNVLCLAVMLLLMQPWFETNDDPSMRMLVNGSLTNSDPHMVFQNYGLGLIYQFLYSLPGRLPWYSIVQYAVLLCSFTGVTYVILRRWKSSAAFYVIVLLEAFFAYEGYISPQFSKTAAFAMGAGIFLLFYALESGLNKHWKALLAGMVLGCFGSMFRIMEAVACAALMTGIGLFVLVRFLREDSRHFWKRFLPYVGVFGSLIVCVVLLEGFDRYVYAKDEGWAQFQEFNALRAQLLDLGFPKYEENKEVYEELDIDETAYQLYVNWAYFDPDKVTPEVMQRLVELQPEPTLSLALVKQFLKSYPIGFFRQWTFYCFLLMAVLWLFYGCHKREGILTAAYTIVLFGVLYLMLYMRGRYDIRRVDVGFWFVLSLVVLWLVDVDRLKFSWQTTGIACLSVVLLCQSYWRSSWWVYHQNSEANMESNREVFNEIQADKEHFYFSKLNLITCYYSYGVFDENPRGVLDNLDWLGGWDCNTPMMKENMAAYGVVNPFRDVVDNPKVYFVDDNIKLTLKYIRKYYEPDAKAVKAKEIKGRNCYQIVTKK